MRLSSHFSRSHKLFWGNSYFYLFLSNLSNVVCLQFEGPSWSLGLLDKKPSPKASSPRSWLGDILTTTLLFFSIIMVQMVQGTPQETLNQSVGLSAPLKEGSAISSQQRPLPSHSGSVRRVLKHFRMMPDILLDFWSLHWSDHLLQNQKYDHRVSPWELLGEALF